MTRKKVKLQYISNDSARKATFKKRKKGLMKKVSELTTLCGIDACAIVYSPYDSQPEIWPSPGGVQRVLSRFKKLPEMEQSKKMVNQESFLRQRIAKANEQLKKMSKDNREKEMTEVMFQGLAGKPLLNLNLMDLNDLGWLIEQNLKDINKRVDLLTKGPHNSQVPLSSTMAGASGTMVAPPDAALDRTGGMEMNMDAMQRQQQWFTDMMHSHDHVGFGGDDMMFPFADGNHNNLWSNPFFP
ncbi:hypothetical protein SLE2022_141470 [Rubroshorea leprosula]|uniref:MADS-box domain-containing protein n=1 Tax=Rubroshorea leprosula TaxID=152421 RepID=A0AAV5M413_9ROSI|nr:hypothetical protein SLEP1_g51445 [Rubroshorea leprosula]